MTTITIDTTRPLPKIGPMKMALGHLIAELGTLYTTQRGCPDFPTSVPHEQDFDDVAEFIRKVSLMHGRFLRKIGIEVRSNALCNIEIARFSEDTFLEAIDGWATDEIHSAGRAAADDLEDRGQGDAGDRRWDEGRV